MEATEHLIDNARSIALEAHKGQLDKAGLPYWTHPERVAGNVRRLYPGAPDGAVAAAWLHDVIEDTEWTAQQLSEHGIPDEVIEAVVALTRLKDDVAPPGYDYYRGVVEAGEIALMAKHADITDNLDEDRLALLDPERASGFRVKYAEALQKLGLA